MQLVVDLLEQQSVYAADMDLLEGYFQMNLVWEVHH